MPSKKILLLYISEDSGHHCASIAIEKALHKLDPQAETLNINSFNYTNPILEKVINRTYMGVIKRTPEIWDYLYDNPKVLKNTQALREMIHRFNTGKLKVLLDEFEPNAVICTQAFPCGMIADYKRSFKLNISLIGVLTDYAPHSYWIYDNVDRYIVPSEETARKLIDNGIDPARVAQYGIPIEPKFLNVLDKEAILERLDLDKNAANILIMGGTQGLGPIKEFASLLDRSPLDLQMIIASGTNKRLYKWLTKKAAYFRKKTIVLPYAPNVDELMGVSSVIVTKPGGITTAEALSKGVPMLIINPLPGQEAMNTKHLLKEGVALKAENPYDAVTLLEELLYNRSKLQQMSDNARRIAHPDSAINTARLVLELV
ncbi:MAG: glycosyltransferase [Candidatus Omnitrophica bacterium]|nr:glycosyltransferase [Candidatus Omnitrophota bacterium]